MRTPTWKGIINAQATSDRAAAAQAHRRAEIMAPAPVAEVPAPAPTPARQRDNSLGAYLRRSENADWENSIY